MTSPEVSVEAGVKPIEILKVFAEMAGIPNEDTTRLPDVSDGNKIIRSFQMTLVSSGEPRATWLSCISTLGANCRDRYKVSQEINGEVVTCNVSSYSWFIDCQRAEDQWSRLINPPTEKTYQGLKSL